MGLFPTGVALQQWHIVKSSKWSLCGGRSDSDVHILL